MTQQTTAMAGLRFRVEDMDCAACAMKIETAVRRLPGVDTISVSYANRSLRVEGGPSMSDKEIMRTVAGLGYTIGRDGPPAEQQDHGAAADGHGHDHGHAGDDDAGPWWRSRKAMATAASALAVVVAFAVGRLFPALEQPAFLIAVAVGLPPIAYRAFRGAVAGAPFSIETLMTIAAVGAVVIGAAEEASVVIVLFLIGEMLEGLATRRALDSIRKLAELVPSTALLLVDGKTEEVAAESLKVGSEVMVRPGDRVPADGVIVEGESALDESPVTGESMPKRKGAGGEVFAGTINTDGVLKVRVSAAASDNTIARVVRLVEEAQEAKAPTERFIERFSRYYTPGVIIVAALVAVVPPLFADADWGTWVYRGLAVLLIGCPCALVISTPAAVAAGLAAGARRGLLVKGGAVLENLRRVTTVALDKTGTLTAGRPRVTDVVAGTRDERHVISTAAALETGSNHPLARAILDRAAEAKVPVPPAGAAAAIAGKGLEGTVGGAKVFLGSFEAASERAMPTEEQAEAAARLAGEGKTVSVLTAGGEVLGLIAMRDEPRADAREGIAAMKRLGLQPLMLTGDNRATGEAIAGELGIEARTRLLPQDKQEIVRALQAKGEVVAKVGDGINDAPALAAADIGIAMGGGTDVALETADAAILHGRVLDVARMVELSQRTMGNITQNLTIALGLKAVFLVTTVIGVTGLWPAILADTGATVIVTANAMRLLAWRGQT